MPPRLPPSTPRPSGSPARTGTSNSPSSSGGAPREASKPTGSTGRSSRTPPPRGPARWCSTISTADNRSCSFRILLQGPRFFGRGLGTEATRLALDYAFGLGVHRVELEVYDFNPRARRVYEKAGFRHEGTKREALLWDGSWVDAHVMAILDTDRP
jgi:RimJ/RimL family protein N-acetyltransferase